MKFHQLIFDLSRSHFATLVVVLTLMLSLSEVGLVQIKSSDHDIRDSKNVKIQEKADYAADILVTNIKRLISLREKPYASLPEDVKAMLIADGRDAEKSWRSLQNLLPVHPAKAMVHEIRVFQSEKPGMMEAEILLEEYDHMREVPMKKMFTLEIPEENKVVRIIKWRFL